MSITWTAGVSSYTTNPVTNNAVVGWSWWTIRQTCSGAIISQIERDPSVRTNTDYHGRMESHPKQACARTRVGWTMGNHDFHQFGYEHIHPYHHYSEAIP